MIRKNNMFEEVRARLRNPWKGASKK